MRTDPHYKTANVCVPEVPARYVEQPLSRMRALSYVVPLLALIVMIFWGGHTVWALITPRLYSPHTTPIVVSTLNSPIDCPNQPPLTSEKQPALYFCSPEYLGNVAGPVGARIVLVGENFPSLPTNWFLSKRPIKTLDALAHCPSNTLKDCLALPAPSFIKKVQTNVFWSSWIWQAPFPVKPGNYFIIAQAGDQFAKSSLSFTLLTSQPPCITITATMAHQVKKEQKPDCTQSYTVSFKRDAVLTIQGTNWLLGWDPHGILPLNMQVEVTAHCRPLSHCSQSQLFDILISSDQLDRDGTFSLPQPLSGNITGTYVVHAWNKTMTTGDPGGTQNTVADDALTFGENTGALILQIV